jgi:hypothetical protein
VHIEDADREVPQEARSELKRRQRPQGTVTARPDILRPVNVDPSGEQPILAASASEIRVGPIPVSRMNLVSMSPTLTAASGPGLAGGIQNRILQA